jgi:type III secretion protein V
VTSLARRALSLRLSPDVALVALVLGLLGALLVPLPAWLLDALLGASLALAACVLLAALLAPDPLRLAAFPTLLLVATLFRLSLNVSSTRLALSEGHAGRVIEAFGEFVVRGDFIVGGALFAILTLVQYLVVAKGAERVAEVSARFFLDAMPGKQMAIDAELRGGTLDPEGARSKRRELERESQLFGAMDGAMKFVKGDVLAGLLIAAVNLIGGTGVGVLQLGLELQEAARTYALIAIGDGLVSQLPSLALAIAAGLLATRVGGDARASLGAQMGAQLFGDPRALWAVSGLCAVLAAVPRMPAPVFLGLSLLLGVGAVVAGRHLAPTAPQGSASAEAAAPPQSGAPPAQARLTLELGPGLAALAAPERRFVGGLLEELRVELHRELGFPIPPFEVRPGVAGLPPQGYRLLLDDVPAGAGEVLAGALYALCPPDTLAYLKIDAEPCLVPGLAKPACRVQPRDRAAAEAAGVPVREGQVLLREHLATLLRRQAPHLLGIQETQGILEAQALVTPSLVKEASAKVPVPLLAEVLRRLLAEGVSLKNLRLILETLLSPQTEGDALALTERCRQALHRYLSHKYAPGGPLYAYLVDPSLEQALRGATQGACALSPGEVSRLLEAVARLSPEGGAVVLAAPDVRRALRKLCEGAFPDLAVLTYAELDADLQVRPIGRLTL